MVKMFFKNKPLANLNDKLLFDTGWGDMSNPGESKVVQQGQSNDLMTNAGIDRAYSIIGSNGNPTTWVSMPGAVADGSIPAGSLPLTQVLGYAINPNLSISPISQDPGHFF